MARIDSRHLGHNHRSGSDAGASQNRHSLGNAKPERACKNWEMTCLADNVPGLCLLGEILPLKRTFV